MTRLGKETLREMADYDIDVQRLVEQFNKQIERVPVSIKMVHDSGIELSGNYIDGSVPESERDLWLKRIDNIRHEFERVGLNWHQWFYAEQPLDGLFCLYCPQGAVEIDVNFADTGWMVDDYAKKNATKLATMLPDQIWNYSISIADGYMVSVGTLEEVVAFLMLGRAMI